jgi:hypothetical protein
MAATGGYNAKLVVVEVFPQDPEVLNTEPKGNSGVCVLIVKSDPGAIEKEFVVNPMLEPSGMFTELNEPCDAPPVTGGFDTSKWTWIACVTVTGAQAAGVVFGVWPRFAVFISEM